MKHQRHALHRDLVEASKNVGHKEAHTPIMPRSNTRDILRSPGSSSSEAGDRPALGVWSP